MFLRRWLIRRDPTTETVFGFCELGLAAIGVYGLVAYWVQQRSREIGVRLALGAEPSGIAMMVVRGDAPGASVSE